jgi:hypothetical protein
MSLPASDVPIKPRRKSPLRRWTWRVLRVAVLAYLGVALVIFAIQDYLIFPGASTQGQRDAILTQGYGNELLSLHTAGGTKIAALFGKALQSDGQPLADVHNRPSVIYFYGNGSCMAYSTEVFDHVRRLGANVIIVEFEGYGMSAGKPSEKGCYAAADAAYDYLLGRNDIDANKIVVMGWSLGAAAAIDLASRRPVVGLVTLSAFTSLRDMAHQVIPWLPTSLLLKYRFDNVGKLPRISCPILIIHGIDDDIVPFEMAQRLADSANGKAARMNIQGAGHNDIFDAGGEKLWIRLGKFLGHLTPTDRLNSTATPTTRTAVE